MWAASYSAVKKPRAALFSPMRAKQNKQRKTLFAVNSHLLHLQHVVAHQSTNKLKYQTTQNIT